MSADPRVTLERFLAPEVLHALDRYVAELIDERAGRVNFANGRPWLTTAEAAEALGCTPRAIRMRVKTGRLQGRYQGRRLYISVQSVIDLGAPSADARIALSTRVAPATRQRPEARPRRKETHP